MLVPQILADDSPNADDEMVPPELDKLHTSAPRDEIKQIEDTINPPTYSKPRDVSHHVMYRKRIQTKRKI